MANQESNPSSRRAIVIVQPLPSNLYTMHDVVVQSVIKVTKAKVLQAVRQVLHVGVGFVGMVVYNRPNTAAARINLRRNVADRQRDVADRQRFFACFPELPHCFTVCLPITKPTPTFLRCTTHTTSGRL